jgi:hypothetical protein
MVKPLEEQLEPGAPERKEPRKFSTVLRLSLTAITEFFQIPSDRVIELGIYVEL